MVLEYGLQLLFLDVQFDWLRGEQLVALVPQLIDCNSVLRQSNVCLPVVRVLLKHLSHFIRVQLGRSAKCRLVDLLSIDQT